MASPTYNDCEQALSALGSDQGVSEFHGLLCGVLCRGGSFEDMRREAGLPDAGDVALLRVLSASSLEDLRAIEPRFQPLLPDDDVVLDTRVVALADWCEAFLHGLALLPGLEMKALSDDAREMVRDLTQISRAGLDAGEEHAGEAEENAYAELVEYLRIGVQLLFIELAAQAEKPGKQARPDATTGKLH